MGVMPEHIADKLSHWIPENCNLMICGLGEPLINPHISTIIKKIKRKNINTAITTNGLLLTPQKIEELIESNIDMIQISVNGFSQGTYDKICPNFNFQLLLNNLQYLSKVCPSELFVQLAFVKQETNSRDLIKLKEFSNECNFSFFTRKTHSRGGYYYKPKEKISFKGCGLFIKSTFIAWNGDILACCHDLEGKIKLGNILNISYEQLNEVKKKIIKNYKGFNICNSCDDFFSRYVLLDNPKIVDN